jgi:large subunit ribosomal protein L18
MDKNKQKFYKRGIRRNRVRSKIAGTQDRPRLSVFRANAHIYAQLIDDQSGKTLAMASSKEVNLPADKAGSKAKKSQIAGEVGKLLAGKALALNIKSVKFDRGGFAYHGRVRALAEGARAGGLEF